MAKKLNKQNSSGKEKKNDTPITMLERVFIVAAIIAKSRKYNDDNKQKTRE